jgi:hypothetical protein
MAVKYHAKVANGTYTDKTGKEQTSWLTVGKVIQKQNGKFCLKMDAIPVAFDGWIQFFDPPQDDQVKSKADPPREFDNMPDDDIGF